jgi:hypothetical protein
MRGRLNVAKAQNEPNVQFLTEPWVFTCGFLFEKFTIYISRKRSQIFGVRRCSVMIMKLFRLTFSISEVFFILQYYLN